MYVVTPTPAQERVLAHAKALLWDYHQAISADYLAEVGATEYARGVLETAAVLLEAFPGEHLEDPFHTQLMERLNQHWPMAHLPGSYTRVGGFAIYRCQRCHSLDLGELSCPGRVPEGV